MIDRYGAFFIVVLVFLCISWKAYALVGTPWWDECVYMGLAKNIVERHAFEINLFHQEAFRPPLYPFLLAILYLLFGFSIKLAYLFNLLIVLMASFVIYEIARRCWNDIVALLSLFLFFSFRELLFWSTKALAEPLEILLVSVFLFVWMCVDDEKKKLVLLPVSTLAFLSKYTLGSLYPLLFILIMVENRVRSWLLSRKFWYSVIISFLILLSWMFHSIAVYGSPVGSATYNLHIVNEITEQKPWNYYFLNFYNIFWIHGLIFLAGAAYLIYRKDREVIAPILWFVLYFLLMSFIVGEKNYRYLLPLLPSVVLVSARFMERMGSSNGMMRAVCLTLIACIFVSPLSYAVSVAYTNKTARSEMLEIAELIRNGKAGSVMSSNYPIYNLLTGRKVIYFPQDDWAMDEFIERYNVSYVVVDSCEYKPDWVERYVEEHPDIFVKVYEKEGWCKVELYQIK